MILSAKFVVVFKAKIKTLDSNYFQMAQILRKKALNQFNCQKFESISENDFEIALSYWNSVEDIHAWLLDADHQIAQNIGKEKWYEYFSVEICEITRSYASRSKKQYNAAG